MPALAVTALTLSHFRSHLLSRLMLDGRPVAIHGPNGAGKTNILEAVSLLSPGRGLRRGTADELIRRPESIGWKITAEIQAQEQVYEIETCADPDQSRQVWVDSKPQPQIALGKIARIVWLVPAMDRLWIEGADGRRRFLDRIAMSFEPGHAGAVLAYEKAMRERNRLLKDMVRDAHWYTALERQMAEAGAQIMRQRRDALTRLEAAQKGAETAFPNAELSLTHPDQDMPDTTEDLVQALSENRSNDMRAGRALIGPHRVDLNAIYTAKGVAAGQCSTGEQKALLISLVLTSARALAEDTGAPPLILLDEVAAHLDAERRTALYEEICVLGAQAWMTSTGPELFDDLGDRAQFFAVTENGSASEVQP
ncbi:MAG: DNA replication/repair protein RecF [Boseongicola sp.]